MYVVQVILTGPDGHKFYAFLLAGSTDGAKFSTGYIILWSFLVYLQGGVIGWCGPQGWCAH